MVTLVDYEQPNPTNGTGHRTAVRRTSAAVKRTVKPTGQHHRPKPVSELNETPTDLAEQPLPKRVATQETANGSENVRPPDLGLQTGKESATAQFDSEEQYDASAGETGTEASGAATDNISDDQPPVATGQNISSGDSSSKEPPENTDGPDSPRAASDFKNALDSAQGRVANDRQNAGQWQELIDQAITLLNSVSQHPALRDYTATKRQLEELEHRLSYGAYPQ